MNNSMELEARLWDALGTDRTVMLGLVGVEDGHCRPMTALIEKDDKRIWFFTSRANAVVQNLARSHRAIAAFSAKGHDLFASIHGNLIVDQDRNTIDRLWSPFIAAWYEGKDDPKLVLLRFDAEHAEVWLADLNLMAGIKMLFGVNPEPNLRGQVGDVDLR